jgi:hypothetical protein
MMNVVQGTVRHRAHDSTTPTIYDVEFVVKPSTTHDSMDSYSSVKRAAVNAFGMAQTSVDYERGRRGAGNSSPVLPVQR